MKTGHSELRRWLAFGAGVGVEIGGDDLNVAVVRVRPSGATVLGAAAIRQFRERPAAELVAVSQRAREGKLSATDIQGGCFTISSLGGIGGTGFTPIVNAPEVAILGVSRMAWKPVYRDGAFVPRLCLPFALSYDHRVIDGATAVRFTTFFAAALCDLRRLIL